jgi:hypothetical protein
MSAVPARAAKLDAPSELALCADFVAKVVDGSEEQ